ncbi:uncharacterized protein LOC135581181 [Musa acuminata AAA Group]|uniref:uncharacterized protein LOC135581181 n=1 Tax=Musa acuminata AAA Group TaxID=214697 RepID=UPI0031DB0139
MKSWIKILVMALAGAVVFLLLPLLFWCRLRRRLVPRTAEASPPQSLQSGIARLQLAHGSNTSGKVGRLFHHHLHHRPSQGQDQDQVPTPFCWNDHPGLVVEAVENGWSRFVFAAGRSPDHLHPRCAPVWGLCVVCDGESDSVETSWEVPVGSADFLQTVRLNPRARRSGSTGSSPLLHGESISIARMLLPLPGPSLRVSSFPQDAYFEITILYLKPHQQQQSSSRASRRAKADAGGESERAKLIGGKFLESPSDATAHDTVTPTVIDINSPNHGSKSTKEEGGKQRHSSLLSLGLTHGGSLPSRPSPGTYRGSIGFHSDGSLHLDGMKLVFESEKAEWAEVNRVIGCGFDPSKKKVFFTVDSELKHVIHCNSDTYKAPLFPLISANADAMLLVNLGQSKFKYEPANARRTPNPCFIRSSSIDGGANTIGYEDSRELFSMGRIDSEWVDAVKKSQSSSSSKKSNVNYNNDGSAVIDVDADSDLFEISLHI